MRILHLTLKNKWFEEIAAGNKKKEFREVKPYWTRRLIGVKFDEVHFRNGYNPTSPFMRVEWLGMTESAGWYVINLGKVLEIK